MKKLIFHSLVLLFTISSNSWAGSDITEQLTRDIAAARTEQDKSRLYMFRARNYKNAGDLVKAEKDYDKALQFDHKGWIHLERAEFYLKIGNYEQARKEAVAARKETPTLGKRSERILALTTKAEKKEEKTETPQVILLTRKWDVRYKKTTSSYSGKPGVRKVYKKKNQPRARGRS